MANYNEMDKDDLLNLLNLKIDTKCYTFEIINNRADLKFKDKKFPQIINDFYEKNIEEIENTPTNITYL